jgi:hypothetical protein
MEKIFIGIDPGVSGAITALNENGKVVALTKMPQTMGELLSFLQQFTDNDTTCYLEKVHARPGDGAASMFKFGQGFGWLQMALLAAKIKTIEVLPNTWMRGLGIKSKKKDETKTAYKNRLKFIAEQLFPEQKVTLWNSDALLIAHSVFVADKKGEVVNNLEG